MNCKWSTIELFREEFYKKFPDSKITLLKFINNKCIKIKNKMNKYKPNINFAGMNECFLKLENYEEFFT